jgi:hypothetical protein
VIHYEIHKFSWLETKRNNDTPNGYKMENEEIREKEES